MFKRMTVKYNLAVSTSRPWTLFKLLFRWRGSVWKSVTFELVIWLLLYFTIGVIYRKVLSPQQIRHDSIMIPFCIILKAGKICILKKIFLLLKFNYHNFLKNGSQLIKPNFIQIFPKFVFSLPEI